MRLIYHKVKDPKGVSPFDAALRETADSAPMLRLASPYIGLAFLNRLTTVARDWRLLSDIEAWLMAGNRRHRAACWAFISNHLSRIRHVAGLHAKVAMGNGKLFLGSANFTEKGILGRTELSLLSDDPALFTEASMWFDTLWDNASSPVIQEGDALVESLDRAEWTTPKSRVRLTSTAPVVAAMLAKTERPIGFDLAGVMAEAGLAESKELLALEDAYHQISDEWRAQERSFSFKALLQAINKVSRGRSRDVWELVILETANHWLGGLEPEGYDRFVYQDGQFRPYFPNEDAKLTTRTDEVLAFVLRALPLLPAYSRLPHEPSWLDVGIAQFQVLPLIELLLDKGLLIERDLPGEIEQYAIDPDFEWPNRWAKYRTAHALFTLHISQTRQSLTTDEEHELTPKPTAKYDHEQLQLAISHLSKLAKAKTNATHTYTTSAQPAKETARTVTPESRRRNRYDQVLAALFEVIAENVGKIEMTQESIAKEMMAAGLPGFMTDVALGEDGFLIQDENGLRLNPWWSAAEHLRNYPQALAAWIKLGKPE